MDCYLWRTNAFINNQGFTTIAVQYKTKILHQELTIEQPQLPQEVPSRRYIKDRRSDIVSMNMRITLA